MALYNQCVYLLVRLSNGSIDKTLSLFHLPHFFFLHQHVIQQRFARLPNVSEKVLGFCNFCNFYNFDRLSFASMRMQLQLCFSFSGTMYNKEDFFYRLRIANYYFTIFSNILFLGSSTINASMRMQ